eukprot:scaffold10248_cov65-Phaeocystis_antarctica.AAC.8
MKKIAPRLRRSHIAASASAASPCNASSLLTVQRADVMLALVSLRRPAGAGRVPPGPGRSHACGHCQVITARGPARQPAPPESAAAGHPRAMSRALRLQRLSLHWGRSVTGTAGRWMRLSPAHAAAPVPSRRRAARSNRPRHSRCGRPRAPARARSCPGGRCAAGRPRSEAAAARTPRPRLPRGWSPQPRAAQSGRRA